MATNLGDKVAVKVDIDSNEYILVGLRSANRTSEVEEQDTTTRDSSGKHNEKMPGYVDESIEVEGLRVENPSLDRHTVEKIHAALLARTTFTCVYGGTETGDTIWTYSNAFFQSLEETNEYNTPRTWSGTIALSGEPAKSTVA
ncbi:MAG: phage tail protein [Bacteroidales bacterium]|nr:phage tail protein [Bacteroidales bacterium]